MVLPTCLSWFWVAVRMRERSQELIKLHSGNLKRKYRLEDMGINGTTIMRGVFGHSVDGCGLNSSSSGCF
jgi:PII-like signaling protein